jgi:catechol 2,3-dioxygenase-like lactoylglutathione lyase family enzyme
MISKINTVPLYVRDQERSRQFYVERLGMEVRTDAEMSPGRRWLEVRPAGAETGFALLNAADFEMAEPGGPAPATLSSTDVRALYATLSAAGVQVTEPVVEPWSTYIVITDPDGWQFIVGEVD